MRKTAIMLLALGLAAAAAAPAFAVSLMTESFTYPNGNLVPNGGWATHSGTGTDIQVLGAVDCSHHTRPDETETTRGVI